MATHQINSLKLMKELKSYQREMGVKIDREARTLLKARFDYPIFLYDAEEVGITATGEEDRNELYPNSNVPQDSETTALELFREFRKHPEALLLLEGTAI
jgi:type I restriction enzyme M protein